LRTVSPAGAAAAGEVGGGLVVGQPLGRQHIEPSEEPAKLRHALWRGLPGEQLHHHDLGRHQLALVGDQLPEAHMDRAAGGAQVLDPGGGVGQDHELPAGAPDPTASSGGAQLVE
jgi:hypothetical protein